MSDVILTVNFLDINKVDAVDYFLKIKPNTEKQLKTEAKPDPVTGKYTEDDYELIYPTPKLWAEEVLTRHVWSILKRGYKKAQKEALFELGDRDSYISKG